MSRVFIVRRISVAVTDKDCDCRVSVRAISGNDKRMISVRQCKTRHGATVKKLHTIAEAQIVEMLGKGV
jgi:hypothetical protein